MSEVGEAGASHTITVGPPTEEDLRRMPSEIAQTLGGVGCAAILCTFAGVGLWKLFGWIGSLSGPVEESFGQWLGALIGATMLFVISMMLAHHASRRRAKGAGKSASVEEIRVRCRRAVRIEGDHSSITPGVCVDIGEGKLLLLLGQWLEDEDRLGVPRGTRIEPSDDYDDFVNRMPAPWSFPAAAFTLRRLASTGDVVSLQVEGPYIDPGEQAVGINVSDYEDLPQSAVLLGSLDDVPTAMTRSAPKIVRQQT